LRDSWLGHTLKQRPRVPPLNHRLLMVAIISAAEHFTRSGRVALVSLIAFSACTGTPAVDNARLELVEHLVRAVPSGASLSGVSAPDSATFVAWGGADVYVLAARQPTAATVLKASRPVAVRLTRGDRLETIEAGEQVVGTYGPDGKRLHARKLSLPIEITGAVAIGDVWMIGGADSSRYHVFSVAPDGHRRPIQQWAGDASARIAPAMHLSPAGRDLLVTDMDAPYSVRRVNSNGRILASFSPAKDALPALGTRGDASHDRWVSLPAVYFGDGYLQTLADLTSDLRVVIAYDRHGNQRSAAQVHAPIGFVGTTPDFRFLVASRGGAAPEFVLYRWRWSEH